MKVSLTAELQIIQNAETGVKHRAYRIDGVRFSFEGCNLDDAALNRSIIYLDMSEGESVLLEGPYCAACRCDLVLGSMGIDTPNEEASMSAHDKR